MHLTRRELLEIAALTAAAAPLRAMQNGDASSLDPIARRAADTIRAHSAEDHHRTATTVDRASADALLARARLTGAPASLEPFELSRVDTAAAFVQMEGQRIDGLPIFDGPFTSAGGVSGTMGPIGGDRAIAWRAFHPTARARCARCASSSARTPGSATRAICGQTPVDIQAVARFARAVADLTLWLANTPG